MPHGTTEEVPVHCKVHGCTALLVLTYDAQDDWWTLTCPRPSAHSFANLHPREHTLPADYPKQCRARAQDPQKFGIPAPESVRVAECYGVSAELCDRYLAAVAAARTVKKDSIIATTTV